MWKDEGFPPTDSSLYFVSDETGIDEIYWKRPCELCDSPSLRDDTSIGKPVQGLLGNCWLLCAFFTLVNDENGFRKVFKCRNKSLMENENNYEGQISFQLWLGGTWQEVIIDDYLPCRETDKGWCLIYSTCEDTNQFWVPLLEKACAKVYGRYAALNSGRVSEGYMLLTGGYTWQQVVGPDLSEQSLRFFVDKIMTTCESGGKNHVCFCTGSAVINSAGSDDFCDEMHCYMILKVEDFCGHDTELSVWNSWRKNKTICSTTNNIRLHDLILNSCTVTFMTKKLQDAFSNFKTFYSETITGKWGAFRSSGGCRQSVQYSQNPQFIVSLDSTTPSSSNVIHVTLFQESKRNKIDRKKLEQAIGIHVWKIPSVPSSKLQLPEMDRLKNIAKSQPEYQYSVDISVLCATMNESSTDSKELCLIIPSTYACNINAQFSLRICCSAIIRGVYKL